MIIHNPILTGSFTVNGTDVASITSSAASIASLNSYTASLNAKSSSFATTGSNTFVGNQVVSGSLTVTGSITTPGTLTAQTLVVQTITSSVDFVTGSTRFGSLSSNTHQFTGSMFVTGALYVATGSVGIGITNPTNPLHIQSNTVSQLNVTALSGNTNAQINLEPTGTGIALIGPANNIDLAFRTNAAERLRIVPSGDMFLTGRSTNTDYGMYFYSSDTDSRIYSSNSSAVSKPLQFYTSGSERMRITSGGNLLVGVTDNAAGYRINAAVNGGSAYIGVSNQAGSVGDRYLRMGFGTGATVASIQGTRNSVADDVNIALQPDGGKVLIGTTTDNGYKLNVNGAVYSSTFMSFGTTAEMYIGRGNAITGGFNSTDFAISNSQSSGRVVVTSNVSLNVGVVLNNGANSWSSYSDIRLKNINGNIKNALNDINTLSAIKYTLKNDISNKQRVGLIAQEIEKILPEAIDVDEKGMLSVRYTDLIPMLISAIQEQQAQVEELKAKLA